MFNKLCHILLENFPKFFSKKQPKLSITFSSFADWYLHKESLSPAARHTIEILLHQAIYVDKYDKHEAIRMLLNQGSLYLNYQKISDITPIKFLTNLTFLNLENNQISDITTLKFLTNLTENLNLAFNQISDITPLQFLTNLTDIYLHNNQISEIKPLQYLTNLTDLDLHNNQISDITPLRSCAGLINLNLSFNQISDITPLRSCAGLIMLDLENNQISDITPLASLNRATELYLRSNQISDITPLKSLTNLRYLDLSNNRISDITTLRSCALLHKLDLSSNDRISDITPLLSLTRLKCLYLENNQISNLTPLLSLTRLTDLKISLIPEHKAIIENSRQKWKTLANSTKPISPSKAAAAVKAAYHALDLPAPEIIFCNSPKAGLAKLQMLKKSPKCIKWFNRLDKQVNNALHYPLTIELKQNFLGSIVRWEFELIEELNKKHIKYWNYSNSKVTRNYLIDTLTIADFYVFALGVIFTPELLKVFQSMKQLLAECGWIFAFENVCIVCSRPMKLSLDGESGLHAEGESAIEFADGYKIYSYHGIILPEKYGKIHPSRWEAQWLLEEKNAEVRRILIQEIGYARICSELQVTELDTWQEYTLLTIDFEDDFDPDGMPLPVFLLKMTCPSTGFIHALRVPPGVRSAKDAIRWVNWDIDPDEFSVQT